MTRYTGNHFINLAHLTYLTKRTFGRKYIDITSRIPSHLLPKNNEFAKSVPTFLTDYFANHYPIRQNFDIVRERDVCPLGIYPGLCDIFTSHYYMPTKTTICSNDENDWWPNTYCRVWPY